MAGTARRHVNLTSICQGLDSLVTLLWRRLSDPRLCQHSRLDRAMCLKACPSRDGTAVIDRHTARRAVARG
jgi:hypothetical protein